MRVYCTTQAEGSVRCLHCQNDVGHQGYYHREAMYCSLFCVLSHATEDIATDEIEQMSVETNWTSDGVYPIGDVWGRNAG